MTQLPQKISSSGTTASSNPTGLNDPTAQLMQIAQPGKWASNLKIMIRIKSQNGSNVSIDSMASNGNPHCNLLKWPKLPQMKKLNSVTQSADKEYLWVNTA